MDQRGVVAVAVWMALTGMIAVSAGTAAVGAAEIPTAEEIHETLTATYPHNALADPEVERSQFVMHPEFEVNLFASAPWVVNPIAMTWDGAGRLWVINGPTYPQILPGQEPTDFISVLEDTDEDGRADKCTVFYDKLYVPTGIAVGDGGVYVANQPDLLFLKDEDGDLRADTRRVLLSGFGTEDNHHAISAFVWGPGGHLYFESGIFLHTQVETPHGLLRLDNGGVFEFRPRSLHLSMFNVGTATNPWGHAFDRWGQSFLTEGPQGGIWYLTPGTVSSHPEERVPGTSAPKSCGVEFLESSHFSEEFRGMMVLNAFKNKTVNLYEFRDDGSGYATREIQPLLLASKEDNFRPVDVKVGPDGAIYIADFYQPIIGHMQYEFRDPRRDHLNGRIWRITQKGRPLLPKQNFTEMGRDELAANLKSPEGFVRDKSRRQLYECDPQEAAAALGRFVESLDSQDPEFEHHRLEALWAYQTIDVVEPELLHAVLRSSEPRARAAAVRVVRYWRDRLPDAFELLAEAAGDAHPRVRLEAVCGLSYFPQARAMEAVARVADQPMDRFLDYAFRHTAIALKDYWLPALQAGEIDFDGNANRIQAALTAGGAADAVGILLKMLEQGQIEPGRRAGVLSVVAKLGSAEELARIFDRDQIAEVLSAGEGGGYDARVHARLLGELAEAARERKVQPAVDARKVSELIGADNEELRVAALDLTGAWKPEPLRGEVAALATDSAQSVEVRKAAIGAIAELGGEASAKLLASLVGGSLVLTSPQAGGREEDLPQEVRFAAAAGLARVDAALGAKGGAVLLSEPPGNARPDDFLDAILAQKGGADLLGAAVAEAKLDVDSAKLALRHLNATGQQHALLIETLRKAVGTGTLTAELAAVDVTELAAEVLRSGDPVRGEEVFRRRDLACQSCHALAGGGPAVAPDLEGVGASSPLDYLVYSVLDPNKAVREGFAAVTVLTLDGRVHTGILKAQSDAETVILNATTRELERILADEIDTTAPAQSIMPKGLVDNMTRSEFVDLVRFLHELGRPGPFATPNVPLVRTWRVLENAPPEVLQADSGSLADRLANDRALSWRPAYSKASGELPLDEFSGPVGIARAQIDVGTAGRLRLAINSAAGLRLWVDGRETPVSESTEIDVESGLRTLVFRVDVEERGGAGVRVLVEEPADSPARARVVNGG